MTYRISREQAQNFPVYSALDRARDRRNSIKENFEKEETERRSGFERPIVEVADKKYRQVHSTVLE